MRVSSAEFIENYETLASKALTEPVTITRNGRDRLVVLSSEEYLRLRRRDRRVVRTGDLSEVEVAQIAQAEVPPGHEELDTELTNWKP